MLHDATYHMIYLIGIFILACLPVIRAVQERSTNGRRRRIRKRFRRERARDYAKLCKRLQEREEQAIRFTY